MPKTKKKIELDKLSPDELLKYEVAAELGIFDKVMRDGWQSLTARETGRIGGLVAKKKKMQKDKER
ncbi:MAG TPA: small, acid-soluble spore protein, alpha/beta type [Candidatus Scybalocola faecigallinarum]|uniref:Small, acid-soluble spore protein, alpha/beta type n=1 Tax=Candidatus Scybalocola faecigallinarum TaxID=2840941 RepID=A0A9D1JRJ8_9FIRM|nr:small, acid-soluble spore protein, alpha/beta type [Candidatus Scybalocola faecigallinarum]